MSVIKSKAELIATKLNSNNDPKAIDPATIMLIVAVIKELIALYQYCHRKPEAAAANMRKPGVVAKRRLNKLLKEKTLPEGKTLAEVRAAYMEVGETITTENAEEMYAEVKAG